MRLRELVRRGELGLRVVAADEEDLDRVATRAYVTDLPDPSRYLSPGDLVLTSCLWHREPADSERFVRILTDYGAVGVVAGLAAVPVPGQLPGGLLEACRRAGLPLLTLGADTSFGPICEAVLAPRLADEMASVRRAADFHRRLVEAVTQGSSILGALTVFHEEFAVNCWVLTPTGEVAAAVGLPPSASEVASVWEYDRLPAADHGIHRVWAVPCADGRLRGQLVCRTDSGDWRAGAPEAVHALLGVIGLELDRTERRRGAEQERVRGLVAALGSDAAAPGEISAHLRMLGADPRLPTVVVAARMSSPAIPEQVSLAVIGSLLTGPDRLLLACVHGSEVFVLVNGEDAHPGRLAAAAQAAAVRYAPLLRRGRLLLGLSEPATMVSQLSLSFAMARERLRSAEGRPGTVVAVHGSKIESHGSLLSALPARLRGSFRDQLLKPLIDYDALHGSDLLKTLGSFLDACGSWQRSAEELHIHVNTLRYRVQRIEELTGRSMSSMHDRVDLYLALNCLSEPVPEITR
ncbi:helix-turn-helix domain-containing protein [Micromonospora sp. CPCC 205371]|nr:helix-turn-helix domain-containing protein [Micromonospora sp. CPCC 205371]